MSGSSRKRGALEPIAALNRVRITEYAQPWPLREPLVDIRSFCPEVVIQTERVCPYLRRSVAEMLNTAQALLPPGYRLRVGTALRTLAMQKGGWDRYFQQMREEHPNWPLSALRRATNRFFAPYDQKAPPGHCTGGAVDVALLDPEGNALDMIAPTKGWEAAYTWSDRISAEAKRNRMLMVEAMLQAGFSNCREEYWHYSWGDSAWAARVGANECPYGWIHPPVALETDFPGGCADDLQMETERDQEGRPLRAEGAFSAPKEAPNWRVGLFWASGIPVTLCLRWPKPPEAPIVFLGDNKESWEPLAAVERKGDTFLIQVTPDADRVYLTNAPVPGEMPEPVGQAVLEGEKT
jgi:D-alanyl-D-alanine dipeptidase